MSSGKTKVVRLRRKGGAILQNCDVYIGRRVTMGGWDLKQSDWANPFSVAASGGASQAISRFKTYLRKQPKLLQRLPELKGKVLGCWCKNTGKEPCHGDVLAALADGGPPALAAFLKEAEQPDSQASDSKANSSGSKASDSKSNSSGSKASDSKSNSSGSKSALLSEQPDSKAGKKTQPKKEFVS